MNETGLPSSSAPSYASHINRRAVVSVSLVIVALISAFSAGSAVRFAVQGQVAEQRAEVMEDDIETLRAKINILMGKVEPATFLNSMSTLAAHDMATAVIYVNSVARMANYYSAVAELGQHQGQRRSTSQRRSRRSRTTLERTNQNR